MARKRPPDQIDRLLDAAEIVFRRQGRGGAQMSAVADEAGVALGTVYHYFTGKESLLRWALNRALIPGLELPAELPIDSPPGSLARQIAPLMDLPTRFPLLHAPPAARQLGGDVRDTFRPVVDELYTTLEDGRREVDLVEAATADDEGLAQIWFGDMVEHLVAAWASHIEAVRAAHGLDAAENAELAARFVITSCTFFARTRHIDRRSGSFPPDAEVRQLTVEMIVGALSSPAVAAGALPGAPSRTAS